MDISCSICIEPFKSNCEVSTTKCGHVFHTKCIMYWFQIGQNKSHVENLDQNTKQSDNNCPKCRKKCSNNELIKTYFDMETKTTSLNPFHGSCCAYRSLAITTNTPGFKKLSTALTLVFSVILLYLVHHQKEKNKTLANQNEYTRLKEFDLGCYMWNKKLWMGNAPLKPTLSECGLDLCQLCNGKSQNRLIMIFFSYIYLLTVEIYFI